MSTETLSAPVRASKPANGFRLTAADVTGQHVLDVPDLDRNTPVSGVTRMLAAQMGMPQNTPWALREESTGTYLDDQVPIGEQVASASRVTLTPRSHLGGG